jgi:enoyl-CoA hydratase/carnithine racemase
MTVYETLLLEFGDDRVATVTLNRPGAMNAFNTVMLTEMQQVWRRLGQDDQVHAIVLRASPGQAFCTGVDVREPRSFPTNPWSHDEPGVYLGPKANDCWKPVVVAVHGMAAGGAFYFINESDIIICSEEATFFDPHVTYGMTSALEPIGMTYRMPLGEVLRMVLLGNDERMTAQTALRIGLVSEVTTAEALWPRAHALAARIAQKPLVALQGTLRAVWESLDMGRRAALQTALKYAQLGNPVGVPQVDRDAVMAAAKIYERR